MNKPTPKRRKVQRNTTSQDDIISLLQKGSGVSDKSKKMLQDMQNKDIEKQSEVHSDLLFNSGAFYDLVLLEYIRPQTDNPRYLPVKTLNKNNQLDTSDLTDCVICDKGVLENRLSKNNPRYQDIEREIEAIKALADSIKANGLLQPIVVWRGNTSNYPIISGHRRYYAICYVYGRLYKIKTKIYPSKPNNLSILRHIENFAREDLTAPDALRSYHSALIELEDELNKTSTAAEKRELICEKLGFVRSMYFRFEKVHNYYDRILDLLDKGVWTSISSANKDLLTLEKAGGADMVGQYFEHALQDTEVKTVEEFMNSILTDVTKKPVKKENPKPGRKKEFITFPRIKSDNSGVILRLLKEDITQLDTGVNWDDLDVDDPKAIEAAIKSVITALSK